MALNVRAQVVDITHDQPSAKDSFLVDTNVWYWLHYPKASQQAQQYQTSDYPNYIKSCLGAGSWLFASPLSFSELAHNIEKAEREIYAFNANKNIPPKEFRRDYPNQRKRIAALIRDVWVDVGSMSQISPINLDMAFLQKSIAKFNAVELDGYDFFMAENAVSSGLVNIITDDSDYCTFPGITVFTANQAAIRAATKSGHLVQR